MGAKEFITHEIERLNGLIINGINKESNIQLKKELSELLYLQEIAEQYHISKNRIGSIFELPDSNTGYSDYRIMNDCESDDSAQWIELRINGNNIRLSEGDIVIRKK